MRDKDTDLHKLNLSILGVQVELVSTWTELLAVIKKDFSYFETNSSDSIIHGPKLCIVAHRASPDTVTLPNKKSDSQRETCMVYNEEGVRYCDYYGKARSRYFYKKNTLEIYSTNFEKSHELTYLGILSLAGKKLDLLGMHKIHAFAVAVSDVALVCMMPSKGGKSTLLKELLKFPDVKIISDDIPFINDRAQVLPFPMKLGFSEPPSDLEIMNKDENLYTMERELYGKKWLVSIEAFKDRLPGSHEKFKRVILIESFRSNREESKLLPVSFWKNWKGIFYHGVLGIGTPMVLELFWINGLHDFAMKTLIFFKRLISMTKLVYKSANYNLELGKNPNKAALLLYEKLKRRGY